MSAFYKRGTILYIKYPAAGPVEVMGLFDDLTSYLVLLKKKDFSEYGWAKALAYTRPKNPGTGFRGVKKESYGEQSILMRMPEADLSTSKVLEEPPPAREELLQPKTIINSKVYSHKNPENIYVVEAVKDGRAKIRNVTNKESWWWTSLTSLSRNYSALE